MKAYLISFLGFIAVILLFSSWEKVEENELYPKDNHINKKISTRINCADCHSDLTELKYKHEPAIDACDNCHSQNENEHPEGKGREFKLTDEMPALCFICHEEATKKRIHAPFESGECAICHSPHSSDNRHLLNNNEISRLCYECHDLEIGEKDRIHAPVEMGSCEECHDSHESDHRALLKAEKVSLCNNCHDNIKTESELKYPHAAIDDCSNCHSSHKSENRNLLLEKMPDLCFTCHEAFDQKHGHVPVQEGECLSCHTVHGSNNRSLLLERNPNDLCMMCHDLEMGDDAVQHAPVEAGECVECHSAHASDHRGLLTKDKTVLCMSCHSDLEEDLIKIHRHAPFEDDCSNCHNSHSSKYEDLLIEETLNLCFTCHDDIGDRITNLPIVHGAQNKALNCSKCHSPHAANESRILLKKEKELCLSCHNKEYVSELGTIKNVKEEIEKSKYVHEPVNEGCSDCHDPHATEYPFLLTDYTAPMMYAPANTRNFQLCFNCHDVELMNLKTGNLATNFRNGNQNLHYVHLKGEKARNCNICHAAHASQTEHLIKEKIWFGQWEMPIGFEPNLSGGSCLTGCHEKKEYSRSPSIK